MAEPLQAAPNLHSAVSRHVEFRDHPCANWPRFASRVFRAETLSSPLRFRYFSTFRPTSKTLIVLQGCFIQPRAIYPYVDADLRVPFALFLFHVCPEFLVFHLDTVQIRSFVITECIRSSSAAFRFYARFRSVSPNAYHNSCIVRAHFFVNRRQHKWRACVVDDPTVSVKVEE